MPVKEDRCSQSNFKQVRKLKFRKINAGSKLNDEVAHLDKNFILLTLNLSDFSFTLWFCSHCLVRHQLKHSDRQMEGDLELK